MADRKLGSHGGASQNSSGEKIRPHEERGPADKENENLGNLRGGADPSGGQSSEVPRTNGRDTPGSQAAGAANDKGKGRGGEDVAARDTSPLSTPSDGSSRARLTEDEMARTGKQP